MAKFSMGGAQQRGTKFNKEKPPVGLYVCEVTNVREHVSEKGAGTYFWLDYKIVEGPLTGFESSWGKNPDDAKGSAKMPRAKAMALDLGQIQAAVAACYGLPEKEAGKVDDAVYQASIAQPSPLAGRKVLVKSVAGNKPGSTWQTVLPYLEGGAPEFVAPAPAPYAPAPTVPAPAAFPPAGWAVHPENAAYFYQPGKPTTPVTEAQLRALSAG